MFSLIAMCACALACMLLCSWVVRARPDLAPSALGFFDGFLSHAVATNFEPHRPRAVAPAKSTAGPTQRKRLTPLQKKKVGALAHWHCELCGQVLDESYEVDHITPVSRGGSNDFSNLRALCRGCHGRVSMAAYIQ